MQKALLIKSRLKDEALKYLSNNIKLQKLLDYEQVKYTLQNHLKINVTLLLRQNDFVSIRQLPRMSIRELSQLILNSPQTYLMWTHNAENNKLIDKLPLVRFDEALLNDIRWEVRKTNPKTFQEALDSAQVFDDAFVEQAITVVYINERPADNNWMLQLNTQIVIQENKLNELTE